MINKNWIQKRWFDFRQGHSYYLIFTLSFGNFVLIFHRLFIERIPELNEIFGNLGIFVIVFILIYIPVAIIIGVWHRRSQMKIDVDVALRQNPLFAKMIRVLLDVQTGKASQEEIENFRKMLKQIEDGKG
jgi:uncharacterized protein YneF (UPF0154 family)